MMFLASVYFYFYFSLFYFISTPERHGFCIIVLCLHKPINLSVLHRVLSRRGKKDMENNGYWGQGGFTITEISPAMWFILLICFSLFFFSFAWFNYK